jgi:hypothetical protein
MPRFSVRGITPLPPQIGTPFSLWSDTRGENQSPGNNITTTVNVPAGSAILLSVGPWATASQNGIVTAAPTDSAGNSYLLVVQAPATAGIIYPCAFYLCTNCLHLPAGSTITAPANTGTVSETLLAFGITGANGGADPSTNTFGTSSSSGNLGAGGISIGPLASSNEIIFGYMGTSGTLGTITYPPGFAEISTDPSSFSMSYAIVNSNAAVTFNPTFTVSGGHVTACLAGLKAG